MTARVQDANAPPSSLPKTDTIYMKMIFVIGLVAFGISAVGTVGSILGKNFCVGMGDITDSMTPEQKAQYEMLPESVKEQFAESLQSSLSSMPCQNVFGLGFKGTIAFFIGVFGLPSILGVTTAMWTHARPATQILCSQQLTDELRAKFSKPFIVKYAMFITGALNIAAFVLLNMAVNGISWPGLMFLISGILFIINLGLVFLHFAVPGVPQSLDLGYKGKNDPSADRRMAEMEAQMAQMRAAQNAPPA